MERNRSIAENIAKPRILPKTMHKIENRFGKDTRKKIQRDFLYYSDKAFDRFEMDIYQYTLTTILQVQKLKDQGVNTEKKTVMVFPGMSGVGIEPVIRTAIKTRFGNVPLSLRLATDSSLESGEYLSRNKILYTLRALQEKNYNYYTKIKNDQNGPVQYWDRSKYKLDSVDKLIGNKTHVLILDPYASKELNTLRQILFVLKPYDIKQIIFITDAYNIDYYGSIEPLERTFGKYIEIINSPVGGAIDYFSRNFTSLFAGIVKMSPLLLEGNPPLQFAKSQLIEREDRKEIRDYLIALGKYIGKIDP